MSEPAQPQAVADGPPAATPAPVTIPQDGDVTLQDASLPPSPGDHDTLVMGNRKEIKDHYFTDNTTNAKLSMRHFLRVSAKQIVFKDVDFRYCFFVDCYFRECTFDNCDFTGCKFVGANLHQSQFPRSRFDYAVFEKTLIGREILLTNAPAWENVRAAFSRSLRTNFQQIGDVDGVNLAIRIEIDAGILHQWKIFRWKEKYFKDNYPKLRDRVRAFAKWAGLQALEFVWGNGESIWKLTRTLGLAVLVSCVLCVAFGKVNDWASLTAAFFDGPSVFLGVAPAGQRTYPPLLLAVLTLCRLVLLSLFISTLARRLSRR